jgi:hypothetical protein
MIKSATRRPFDTADYGDYWAETDEEPEPLSLVRPKPRSPFPIIADRDRLVDILRGEVAEQVARVPRLTELVLDDQERRERHRRVFFVGLLAIVAVVAFGTGVRFHDSRAGHVVSAIIHR